MPNTMIRLSQYKSLKINAHEKYRIVDYRDNIWRYIYS